MNRERGAKGGLTIRPKDLRDEQGRRLVHKRGAIDVLNVLLPRWKRCRIVSAGSRILVTVDDVVTIAFDERALKQELSSTHFKIVKDLLNELHEQAQVAEALIPLAKIELETQKKRIQGGTTRGQSSAKESRTQVERLIRTQLRLHADPTAFFQEWEREFGYSPRQLRNILKKITEETR